VYCRSGFLFLKDQAICLSRVDRDIALLIADGVYNRLKSSNIRECVRIARLAKSDSAQVNRIIDTFAKYGGMIETL
jgi:hypothetical protein